MFYKIILVFFLLFLAKGLFATDESGDKNISTIGQNNQIDQTEIDKMIKIEKIEEIIDKRFKIIEKNLESEKWTINTMLVIIGILATFSGIIIPVIMFVFGKLLFDDIEKQKAKIEIIAEKSKRLFDKQQKEIKVLGKKIYEFKYEAKNTRKEINNLFLETDTNLKRLVDDFKKNATMDTTKREENIKTAKELSEKESLSPYEKDLTRAMQYCYSYEFDKALNIFEIILDDYKEELNLEKLVDIYIYMGYILNELGKINKDVKEKERLYKEAIEKCEKAIEINPSNNWAYNDWGWALVKLSKLKDNDEKNKLLNEAEEKLKKCIKLGGYYRNLVRLYAITNRKDEAFEYMEKELKEKDGLFKYFDEDEENDFKNLKDDERYKTLKEKYGNK